MPKISVPSRRVEAWLGWFLTLPGKLRLLFDGRQLNAAVKASPRFNMKSHATVGRLVVEYNWAARGHPSFQTVQTLLRFPHGRG